MSGTVTRGLFKCPHGMAPSACAALRVQKRCELKMNLSRIGRIEP